MIKKIVCLCAIATLTLVSCKKEENKNELIVTDEMVDGSSSVQATTTPVESQEAVQTPPADGKYPIMTFEKTVHNFGLINPTDKVTYTFDFKNTGAADLLISDAKGSCGCTIPEYPKEPIKAGESGKIKVLFNPAGKKGEQMKSVTITANTLTGKETINIKASIKAEN